MSKFEQELEARGLLQHVLGVCEQSGLTLAELFDSRSPPAPAARSQVYKWLRDEKGYALKRIGRLFKKPHTSVLYGLRTLEGKEP